MFVPETVAAEFKKQMARGDLVFLTKENESQMAQRIAALEEEKAADATEDDRIDTNQRDHAGL